MPSIKLPTVSTSPLNGSQSISELAPGLSGPQINALGKQTIKDIGARYAQIVGLKPGSTSIRTPEMIDELLERLIMGESVSAILCDVHMPAPRTLWNWTRDDQKLDEDIKWAQAIGQRTLKDLTLNIAAKGEFSSDDVRRDELMIRVIDKNASQRNRAEFGDHLKVEATHTMQPVVLAPIQLPDITGEFDDDPDADGS